MAREPIDVTRRVELANGSRAYDRETGLLNLWYGDALGTEGVLSQGGVSGAILSLLRLVARSRFPIFTCS